MDGILKNSITSRNYTGDNMLSKEEITEISKSISDVVSEEISKQFAKTDEHKK